jgi:hypothetical protein
VDGSVTELGMAVLEQLQADQNVLELPRLGLPTGPGSLLAAPGPSVLPGVAKSGW